MHHVIKSEHSIGSYLHLARNLRAKKARIQVMTCATNGGATARSLDYQSYSRIWKKILSQMCKNVLYL